LKIDFKSIRIKIILILLLILMISTGTIIFIAISVYKNDMLSTTKRIFNANTDMLYAVIRNIMINGEASIVVNTISSIKEIDEFKELTIYRSDGTAAFSDYTTLDSVNRRLGVEQFEKTTRSSPGHINTSSFRNVVQFRHAFQIEIRKTKELEYLVPLMYKSECRACHSPENPVRGVGVLRVSLSGIYRQINKIIVFSPVFFFFISSVIGLAILLFLNRLVIYPLLKIGSSVLAVGQGNLDIVIPVIRRDEIGDLSDRINEMIRGLKERFILSRYVSKSTEQFVKNGLSRIRTEKKELTVVFSDIRGFTSYSEMHDPEHVVGILNNYLSIQADIIEKNSGDVDNFIGDAIMGVFSDPYLAVHSGYEMIKGVIAQDQELKTGLRIGIGIATGEIISGDIGSEKRKKNTVIGDAVNLASRLASLAKPGVILISEQVNTQLQGRIKSELVADQKIKGKSHMINYYIVHTIYKPPVKS
jgi:adenylate cyclase